MAPKRCYRLRPPIKLQKDVFGVNLKIFKKINLVSYKNLKHFQKKLKEKWIKFDFRYNSKIYFAFLHLVVKLLLLRWNVRTSVSVIY